MNNNKVVQKVTGRPSKITKVTVAKLISVLKLSVPVETACEYAGINKSTFYRNYETNEAFATEINDAKHFARIAAGNVVMNAIVNDQDVQTARWWLEKKHPDEFVPTGASVNVQGEKVLVIPSELLTKHGITPNTKTGSEKQS